VKAVSRRHALAAAAALSIGGAAALPSPAPAQMAVFDTTNYAQNLLQAARALEQINNQISSLQNEAAMLRNMGKNSSGSTSPSWSASGARCSASTG
jgi:P-type conjugative transfer protein TrbJ